VETKDSANSKYMYLISMLGIKINSKYFYFNKKKNPRPQYLYREMLSPSALETKGNNTAVPVKVPFYLTKQC